MKHRFIFWLYKYQKEESRVLLLSNTFVRFFLPQTSSTDLLLRKEGEVAQISGYMPPYVEGSMLWLFMTDFDSQY